MIERPILFNGEMVRAILEGRKTQTRRVIKPQPIQGPPGWLFPAVRLQCPGRKLAAAKHCAYATHTFHQFCPYGQPFDRLWVRETWAIEDCGKRVSLSKETWPKWPIKRLLYLATMPQSNARMAWCKRPSIHMPRWASRITLEIVSVRVERLQGISEQDALAEGVLKSESPHIKSWPYLGAPHPIKGNPKVFPFAVQAFADIWKHIYGPDAWDQNPWVWVIEFKRVAA